MKITAENKKIKEIKSTLKSRSALKAVSAAVYFLVGLILSRNFVLQYASPFAVSVIPVSKSKNYFYSAAGAALDGAMGAGLLSKLLSAGFGFDSALKVVNSALLVKSNDESLATLDCACVDLFTGRVDFYKAGAPASYLVKNNHVTKCELSSMPAGILRGIEFAKRTAVLSNNDLIVLTSDGITDLGADWISAMLTGFEDTPVQVIADEILKEALNITKNMKEDDMSIIAARLHKID
ncbi:MAG: serine/threonine-protein phosphatase [Clostridiales bacterium]|nr:serine/threonine-protein phosphatase [Clostridiales bacterium]